MRKFDLRRRKKEKGASSLWSTEDSLSLVSVSLIDRHSRVTFSMLEIPVLVVIMVLQVILLIASYAFKAFFLFLCSSFLAGIASVFQERKIWKSRGVPNMNVFGLFKVYALNVMWMGACLLGAVYISIRCMSIGNSHTRALAHNWMERTVAKFVVRWCVGPVEIKGAENLPPALPGSPAPIYIANHASQIDVAVVYYLDRPFRWIAKSSVVYLPGVGQIMWLSGHVFIDRVKKTAGSSNPRTGARNLYIQSNKSIQEGVPMFFFPQGTRRMVEKLPFKDGAFKIALENESPLVPISIDIPIMAWNSMYPFTSKQVKPVVLTVHKPIPTKGIKLDDIEALKTECYDTIYSVLPDFSKEG
jgi:lysophosphatidate acyltransferase